MRTTKITQRHISESYKDLAERVRLDLDFVLLTVGAAAISFFGFCMNSPSVIVGAMVISPLLYAVVGISAASFRSDWKIVLRSIKSLLVALMVAVTVSALLGIFFSVTERTEIIDRLSGSPMDYFFVALFSGLTGTFAFFWPDIIDAVAGIAIAVALIPPVVLVGIGLGNLNHDLMIESSLIVLINIIGIYLGSLLMFIGLRFLARED